MLSLGFVVGAFYLLGVLLAMFLHDVIMMLYSCVWDVHILGFGVKNMDLLCARSSVNPGKLTSHLSLPSPFTPSIYTYHLPFALTLIWVKSHCDIGLAFTISKTSINKLCKK